VSAATVAELGSGRFDGQAGEVVLPSGRREALFWDATASLWRSNRYLTMRQIDNVGMRANGSPTGAKYPTSPENPNLSGTPNPTAFGFQIHTTHAPDEIWQAGLRLQEHLACEFATPDMASALVPEIFLNWYELGIGDAFLSPEGHNQGVHNVGELRPSPNWGGWYSSGWQNSPVSEPGAFANWYPELYLEGQPINFRNFTAWHRWAGPVANLGATGSFERASQYPALSNLLSWNSAAHIPVADNAQVAEWPDFSGRGRHLVQSTTTKRPVVRRDSPGSLRHVRFDGTNDSLIFAGAPGVYDQPITVFMTLRQNTGGGAQQVWLGALSSGPPLIYRGDATNQVNVWAGAGADLTYDRGSNWPSPFMIVSVVFNGASTSVWEMSIVKLDRRTFAAVPQLANNVTTIDGYVFVGFPYYDPSGGPSAVGTWLKLLADPDYASLPPVTSISVDSEVSGTVDPPNGRPDLRPPVPETCEGPCPRPRIPTSARTRSRSRPARSWPRARRPRSATTRTTARFSRTARSCRRRRRPTTRRCAATSSTRTPRRAGSR
jgi:hypothetical protein